jgi:hypothetical protein
MHAECRAKEMNMKSLMTKSKVALIALVSAPLLLVATPSHAGRAGDVIAGVVLGGIVGAAIANSQPVHAYSSYQPAYVQPAPVYVQPRPVYVEPQPVYVQPAPVYYGGYPREHCHPRGHGYYGGRGGYGGYRDGYAEGYGRW